MSCCWTVNLLVPRCRLLLTVRPIPTHKRHGRGYGLLTVVRTVNLSWEEMKNVNDDGRRMPETSISIVLSRQPGSSQDFFRKAVPGRRIVRTYRQFSTYCTDNTVRDPVVSRISNKYCTLST